MTMPICSFTSCDVLVEWSTGARDLVANPMQNSLIAKFIVLPASRPAARLRRRGFPCPPFRAPFPLEPHGACTGSRTASATVGSAPQGISRRQGFTASTPPTARCRWRSRKFSMRCAPGGCGLRPNSSKMPTASSGEVLKSASTACCVFSSSKHLKLTTASSPNASASNSL